MEDLRVKHLCKDVVGAMAEKGDNLQEGSVHMLW